MNEEETLREADRRYWFDPEFHAKVHTALQIVGRGHLFEGADLVLARVAASVALVVAERDIRTGRPSMDRPHFERVTEYVIQGRGRSIVVRNPGGYPEPNDLTGQVVEIEGESFKVRGVETHSIARPYPDNYAFALLVGEPDD